MISFHFSFQATKMVGRYSIIIQRDATISYEMLYKFALHDSFEFGPAKFTFASVDQMDNNVIKAFHNEFIRPLLNPNTPILTLKF
jgi:hypothetical protein